MQQILIIFFDTLFTDVVGGCIVIGFSVLTQFFQIVRVDTGNIAEGMGHGLTERVVAFQVGFNEGSRKTVLVDGENGYLFFTEIFGNHGGEEFALIAGEFDDVVYLLLFEFKFQQFVQAVDVLA